MNEECSSEAQESIRCDPVQQTLLACQSPSGTSGWCCASRSHTRGSMCRFKILVFKIASGLLEMKDGILDD